MTNPKKECQQFNTRKVEKGKVKYLWGRHPNYAYGQWIKLSIGHNCKEFAYRERMGFELCYFAKGENPNESNNYEPGHPWYYFLGGTVLPPKQIMKAVQKSGYKGFDIDRIEKANAKEEPQRSENLRLLKQAEVDNYYHDLSRYRQLAFQLSQQRRRQKSTELGKVCEDVHVNLSLKYSHLYNRFAHLIQLEEQLGRQLDLFGGL